MARITIEDLPKDMKIVRAELRAITGGGGTVDTCQTPSGSPIPVPLTNIGTLTDRSDTDLGNDSTSGQDSSLTSTGDEAGAAQGIITANNMDLPSYPSRNLSTSLNPKQVISL